MWHRDSAIDCDRPGQIDPYILIFWGDEFIDLDLAFNARGHMHGAVSFLSFISYCTLKDSRPLSKNSGSCAWGGKAGPNHPPAPPPGPRDGRE